MGKKVSECQPTISDIQSAPQEEHQLRRGAHLLAERKRLQFYVMSRSMLLFSAVNHSEKKEAVFGQRSSNYSLSDESFTVPTLTKFTQLCMELE